MLCRLRPASTIGCHSPSDARGQLQRDRLAVTELPHLSVGIALPSRLLRPFSHGHLGKGDTHPDNLIVRVREPWRFPVGLADKEFLVTIAHADETVTILREQLAFAVT